MELSQETLNRCFTDFDGRLRARLSSVIPVSRQLAQDVRAAPTSARYDCVVKIEYQRDLMRLVEDGMLMAARSFRGTPDAPRFTLLEVSRVEPAHYGLAGVRDYHYYPLQFEVIEQAVPDWEQDDRSTMMVQAHAIPVNYDMLVAEKGPEFRKGFSYPVVGERAYILNDRMVNEMYNGRIMERMGVKPGFTSPEARRDPRIGLIKMFESSEKPIPIYVDYERLLRYHFGIFSYTGGGKSNLLSNILRRILIHTEDTRVVIFDISLEYPFLLMDVFSDPSVDSRIVLEHPVEGVEQFSNSIVKPSAYEEDARFRRPLSRLLEMGRVTHLRVAETIVPTYNQVLGELEGMRQPDRPTYNDAINEVRRAILNYMESKGLERKESVDEKFVDYLDTVARSAIERFGVSEKAVLYAWATTRSSLAELIATKRRAEAEEKEGAEKGLTVEQIMGLIQKGTRLACISIADPETIKNLLIELVGDFLRFRKRRFKVKPFILFVFDEAQEFIPAVDTASGVDRECSREVEMLLRQGRKYGLGGCIATQRIAYLNTNALQQLHTYFVGTLPRPYDRALVSSTFTIDEAILEKTLEFAPGEWLLSSYIATGMENVPIFIKADNSEEELERFIGKAAR